MEMNIFPIYLLVASLFSQYIMQYSDFLEMFKMQDMVLISGTRLGFKYERPVCRPAGRPVTHSLRSYASDINSVFAEG